MSALEGKLLARVIRTIHEHELLRHGDRVMVCLSGGKDSFTLLQLLREAARRLPQKFELVAVHLDQRQPGYDGAPLREWLERSGVPFELLSEDTYSEVLARTREGGTYCAACSRLRRGILYTAAERLGATRIALGHHREDTLETFLLNLVYTGKLQAMPAKYRTDDGRFDVIRPMIECAEADIAAFAAEQRFPIIPCNLCGSQQDSRRDAMGALLARLDELHPRARQSMLAALGNVRPTHLLDVEVAEAWAARPAHLEARSQPKETATRFAALPVHSNVELLLAPPTPQGRS
ncbi:MAG: tRNA 2-thiocytidine(32) synthetase TtcA [Myxococcota bacterium]